MTFLIIYAYGRPQRFQYHVMFALLNRSTASGQKSLTFPEHGSSPPVFSWVHVAQSVAVCVLYLYCCLSFVPFLLAIVLFFLLRFMASDYPLVSPMFSFYVLIFWKLFLMKSFIFFTGETVLSGIFFFCGE